MDVKKLMANRRVLLAVKFVGVAVLYSLMVLVPLMLSDVKVAAVWWIGTVCAVLIATLITLGVASVYRRLVPHLGRVTTFVGLIGASAVVGTGVAWAVPDCPTATVPGRCTLPAAGGDGLLLAVTVVLVGMVLAFVASIRKVVTSMVTSTRVALDSRRERHQEKDYAAARSSRAATKKQNPEAPKGYPTPKRSTSRARRNPAIKASTR